MLGENALGKTGSVKDGQSVNLEDLDDSAGLLTQETLFKRLKIDGFLSNISVRANADPVDVMRVSEPDKVDLEPVAKRLKKKTIKKQRAVKLILLCWKWWKGLSATPTTR